MAETFINPSCPHLPEVDRVWKAADVTALGDDRGPGFYEASLCYAQSQWRTGFPAQAILQINRSLACFLPAGEMKPPLAYRALAWILQNRREGQFLGNPTRHFQHLATRMVEPHKELRTWRAWACWEMARAILPADDFPGDARQIRAEGIVEPTREEIEAALSRLSPADDVVRWKEACPGRATSPAQELVFVKAELGDLETISKLAHQIWPVVYPGIITDEQIRYMLNWMYAPEKLRKDVTEGGVTCYLIKCGSELPPIGFLAVSPEDDVLFLHKLYLLPEHIGSGLGARALDWVFDLARSMNLHGIRLRVNKNNTRAIRAYLRRGFVFEQDIVAGIGGGFVMDDYVMARFNTPSSRSTSSAVL